MSKYEVIHSFKPIIRQNKSIIFKGKKYPIDFQLLEHNSNYFYRRRHLFEYQEDINLEEEFTDISEESIKEFISSIQNERFVLNQDNLFPLHILSIKYDVPLLKKITDEVIKKYDENFIFQTIQFKYSIINGRLNTNNNNVICDDDFEINLLEEEEEIANNFFEYVNKDELSKLPVDFLYRVVNNKRVNQANMSEQESKEYIEFIFKCLDEHKQEGSVLLLNLDIEYNRIEIFEQLVHKYSNHIDLGMINPAFYMKTSINIMKDLLTTRENTTLLKEELQNILNEKAIIEQEKEKILLYKQQLEIELDEERKKIQKLLENQKKQTKEKEELISENKFLKERITQYEEGKSNENMFISEFNSAPLRTKELFIQDLKKENLRERLEFFEKIERLLEYLKISSKYDEMNIEISSEKEEKMNDIKEESHIKIKYKVIENLFNEKRLNTKEFCDILNTFKYTIIEIKYPGITFDDIYKEVINITKRKKNEIKICIFISGINQTGYSFQNNRNINFILLDSTVKEIIGENDKGSFKGCSSLVQISIPSSVIKIGNNAFYKCSSLTQISIPSSVTSVCIGAFEGCTSLKQVSFVIPSLVSSIDEYSFRGCSSLIQITIPQSVTSIGIGAFDGCTSLTQISIPSFITSIGLGAFCGCSSLTQISFENPSFLISIGDYAFNGCSALTKISIPSSVIEIGNNAFCGCPSLEQILIPSLFNRQRDRLGISSSVKIENL